MKQLFTLMALLITSVTFGQETCNNVFDYNDNNTIDIEDFLAILGLFADVDLDDDGTWDSLDNCLDLSACNYASEVNEPCTYLPPGDCDCNGNVLDECGVCEGTGLAPGTCDCSGTLIDVIGVCGGDCWMDEDADGICDDADECVGEYESCAPAFGTCGDPMNYKGYDYATVQIGDQCWFAENLRNRYYQNGDSIPSGLSDSEWQNAQSGAVAVYGEDTDTGCGNWSPDIDSCDPAESLSEYGRHYNWYAVDDARGLCPSGWHVPTDGEWTVLTDHLGGASVAGGTMKSTYGWNLNGNGTNSSGFSGLPGGILFPGGISQYAGYNGTWWSASPTSSNAWARFLYDYYEGVFRFNDYSRSSGMSVRCIQNTEE